MTEFIKQFVSILVTVLWIAIIARSIISFFPIGSTNNPLVALVYQITEPILAPLRRVVPRLGIFDITPMVAIGILFFIRWMVNEL